MYVNLKLKKIGGSLFGRFDSADVKALKLKENQTVKVTISEKPDYMQLFGIGKHLKLNSQKLKDELRDEFF